MLQLWGFVFCFVFFDLFISSIWKQQLGFLDSFLQLCLHIQVFLFPVCVWNGEKAQKTVVRIKPEWGIQGIALWFKPMLRVVTAFLAALLTSVFYGHSDPLRLFQYRHCLSSSPRPCVILSVTQCPGPRRMGTLLCNYFFHSLRCFGIVIHPLICPK